MKIIFFGFWQIGPPYMYVCMILGDSQPFLSQGVRKRSLRYTGASMLESPPVQKYYKVCRKRKRYKGSELRPRRKQSCSKKSQRRRRLWQKGHKLPSNLIEGSKLFRDRYFLFFLLDNLYPTIKSFNIFPSSFYSIPPERPYFVLLSN